MMGSLSRTLHFVDNLPLITQRLQEKASHLDLKKIPVKAPWLIPEISALGRVEEIEVLFCDSWQLAGLLNAGVVFPNLKWAYSVSTGIDYISEFFIKRQVTPSYVITSSRASADVVPEYVIGQMLATRRCFYDYHSSQEKTIWKWIPGRGPIALRNYTVVLLGVGRIGKRTAELCKAFGMTVYGVTRSPVEKDHGSPHVDHYRTQEELDSALSQADYIVNMLPSTPLTRGLLDNDALHVCSHKKPLFINVGRGDIMSQDSLLKALRCGWLSGAVMDVFTEEPLPADSPLWQEPGVIITPHIAMDVGEDTVEKMIDDLLDNHSRLLNNQPLKDVVDVLQGY